MAEEPMRDRARTRERILSATEALLGAQSARDLKVRDIAARAGVSASLVVQYFISKDALVLDVGLRRMAAFAPPPPDAGVAAAVAAMVAADFRDSALLREVLRQSWWWPRESERLFQDAIAPRRRALQAAIPAALPAQVDAALSVYFEGLRKCFIDCKPEHECAVIVTNIVLAAVTPKVRADEF